MKLREELNAREFAQHLKNTYRYFTAYCNNNYIGEVKYIFGYYAYIESLDEKREIIDIAATSNGGAILYVK